MSGKQSTEQKKSETIRFPTLNFEAFSISAILRILKLINASKTHFSINNSKSYYKIRKTFFFLVRAVSYRFRGVRTANIGVIMVSISGRQQQLTNTTKARFFGSYS